MTTTVLTAVYTAAVACAAGVLLYAGAAKLAAPRAFRRTLRELRLPFGERLWLVVPMVEIGCAALLLIRPGAVETSLAVGGLGLAFAVAGAAAHVRGLFIRCACFGRDGAGRLGLRQVALLPVWWAIAALTHLWGSTFLTDRASVGAVVAVGCLAVAVAQAVPVASAARAYLLSAVNR